MKQQFILFLLLSSSIFIYGQGSYNEPLPSYFPKGNISLRTNVAPWLMLTPNLGIEYKAADNIGLLVDGGYAHWKLNTQNRYRHFWSVSPQVCYYTGSLKDNYLGLQYTMGEYNIFGWQGANYRIRLVG